MGQCSTTSSPSPAPSWYRAGTLCSGTARKWVKTLYTPTKCPDCPSLSIVHFCLYLVFSYSLPSPFPSLFFPSLPFYCLHHLYILADKYNTLYTEDQESLAIKCLRLSAIMKMQPPFIKYCLLL